MAKRKTYKGVQRRERAAVYNLHVKLKEALSEEKVEETKDEKVK